MERIEEQRSEHFSLTFIIGLLVGGVMMFILGTKKGRKLLEEMLSEGEKLCGELLEKNPQLEDTLEEKTAKAAGKISKTKEAVESIIDKSNGLRSLGHKTAARFFHKNGKPLV